MFQMLSKKQHLQRQEGPDPEAAWCAGAGGLRLGQEAVAGPAARVPCDLCAKGTGKPLRDISRA